MNVLVDMNLSPRWVSLLVGRGMSARHWSEIGKRTAPDAEIMAYAAANDYVVLTHDLDFSAILAATHGEKPSGCKFVPRMSVRTQSGHRLWPHCSRWSRNCRKVRC